jgi:putative Mg2+ transporter-C (MgtC) family protein
MKSWLGDWNEVLPFPWATVALTLVTLVSGAVIGTERQRREKPAGLRTLMLVCLGSAAFTMVSFSFTTTTHDTGRVAAQIVTGIGFLGAGAILHGRAIISGMTTAATIWIAAAVGMVAGAGYAAGALGLSMVVRFVLVAIGYYEIRLAGGHEEKIVTLDFESQEGMTRVRMERILSEYPAKSVTVEWRGAQNGNDRLLAHLTLPKHHLCELLDDLVNVPGVKSVHEKSP